MSFVQDKLSCVIINVKNDAPKFPQIHFYFTHPCGNKPIENIWKGKINVRDDSDMSQCCAKPQCAVVFTLLLPEPSNSREKLLVLFFALLLKRNCV